MKKYVLSILIIIIGIDGFAQMNESNIITITAPKNINNTFPPNLFLVPESIMLEDPNNNNVIDAGEAISIRFEIYNKGRGDAINCIARIGVIGDTDGIIIKDVPLPIIQRESKKWVTVPIKATNNVKTGEINISISVEEPKGYGIETFHYKIGTHKLRTPFVEIVSYKVIGDNSGKLERRKPFLLQIAVQNTDQGIAENINVDVMLPENVNWNGGDPKHVTFDLLKPNETKTLNYELMANQNAAEEINIEIHLTEKTKRYAKNAPIVLRLGQHVGGTITMNVERKDHEVKITKTSLVSDVDTDIPLSKSTNNKSFVLIVANETYQQVAPVPFALNDGNIFREYCQKTLGVPEKHIHYLANATYNQIKAEVNWLKNITETFDDAQIILYYAGHGIPDEASKTAYLLPVDGSGTDVSTGYKLDDLYTTLGHMPASQIVVFMDACFSGSKREHGMLASARGVALKVKSSDPQGNMVVFSAAQGDETAYPNREKQHGLFTYYLLKKLQETAGDVSLQELGKYIETNVKQQSVLLNSKLQTPCVIPSADLDANWKNWTLK